MSSIRQILLLGAGELGTAFVPHISALPNVHITIGIRSPAKYQHLASFNVSIIQIDLTSPSDSLSKIFANYDVIISATGFGKDAGTVTKIAREVLAAGDLRSQTKKDKLWFFPWQWGVDFDIIGDGEGLMPLFGEQVRVRNLLRAEAKDNVKWTIVSTGIFMSFLFEPFWDIVDVSSPSKIVVRALGSWEHKVSVTDVSDIGKVLARIVAGDTDAENRILYIAGDTVSYNQLAGIIERVTGEPVEREEWTIPYLKADLAKEPNDLIKKYRLVFGRDGVWWDKEGTVNAKLGIPMISVEEYAQMLYTK